MNTTDGNKQLRWLCLLGLGAATMSALAAPLDGRFHSDLPPTFSLRQGTGKVKEIIVKGNQRFSKQGILATMQSKVGSVFSQATLDSDKQALSDLGVFKSAPLVTVVPNDDGTFSITVEVVENPVIKEIRLVGNSVFTQAQIMAVVTLKPGTILSNREAAITSKNVTDLYVKKGFFARVTDISYLPESPSTLNITIIEKTISEIKVTGNTRTKKWVLDRLIKSRAGDAFNVDKWRNDLRRMANTQWFEKFDPTSDEVTDPYKIALGVDVREGRTGTFGLGLQVDPQSSFAGFIKLGEQNVGGTGQSINGNFSQGTSGGGPSLSLDYGNPFFGKSDNTLQISAYSRIVYRFTNNLFGGTSSPTAANQYYERHTGGAVGLSHHVSEKVSVSTSLRYEGVNTSNLDTTQSSGFIQQDGTIGSLTLGITRNTRDTDVDASAGSFLSLNLEPGISNITKVGGLISNQSTLGSHSFTKVYGDLRYYFSKGKPRGVNFDAPRKVWALRIRAGTISGSVPFFEQFFAGGASTVRGYQEDRYWGNTMLMSTLEYRYPIQKAFNLIGFVDYGGAWGGYDSVNSFTQSPGFRLHFGYGLGLSFRTPLGPIRIDLGFNEKGGSMTYFQIGTSF